MGRGKQAQESNSGGSCASLNLMVLDSAPKPFILVKEGGLEPPLSKDLERAIETLTAYSREVCLGRFHHGHAEEDLSEESIMLWIPYQKSCFFTAKRTADFGLAAEA